MPAFQRPIRNAAKPASSAAHDAATNANDGCWMAVWFIALPSLSSCSKSFSLNCVSRMVAALARATTTALAVLHAALRAPPAPRRRAEHRAKCLAEGGLGLVTDRLPDLRL